MKSLLKVEELLLAVLAGYLFLPLGYAWWWFLVLLLLPDLSMLGYLASPRLGALAYNLVHHKATAVGCYLAGALLGLPLLQAAGLILLGHSSLDRVFGYGLKYPDSFKNTHLGVIGQER
jgi:hypothetical protein